MRLAFASLLALASLAAVGGAQSQAAKTLDTYYIDVEGGLSALYVSPTGESLLIDTGSPGGRDAGRILETLKMAGVTQIDHMLSSHYHGDHVGGLQEVAEHVSIKHFYDHGPSSEPREQVPGFRAMYEQLLSKAEHTVLKPGDRIPLAGTTVIVVTSAGQVLKTPIAGAPGAGQPNAACADFTPRDESHVDPDNHMSVGVVISYGKFRTVNLGDFTYNREKELMCPDNNIGKVDVYMTSHHGIDQSGSPALVHGLSPRVAVMNNSAFKGGAVPTMRTLFTSPGLEDVWQLHWAYAAGLELNAPSLFIANVEDTQTLTNTLLNPPAFLQGPPRAPGAAPGAGAPPPPGAAPGGPGMGPGGPGAARQRRGHNTDPFYVIKVSGFADGSFTVTNTRNNFTKTYAALK
jgi:beta-lactamase superfamily II metal-dependent hydrolase